MTENTEPGNTEPGSIEADATADEPVADPAEMLALLKAQQKSVEGQIAAFVPWIISVWGVAWLFGFGALWLIDGLRPGFGLPAPLAAWIFGLLILAAVGVSAWLGIRSNRGIRSTPAAAFTGASYGITWSVGSIAIFVLGAGLSYNGMPSSVASVFYPSAYVIFAGIMYILAGAIWQAVPSVILGGYTVVIGAAAPFFGYPRHYLFLALAGGLGFLALGFASLLHLRRLRRSAAGGSRP